MNKFAEQFNSDVMIRYQQKLAEMSSISLDDLYDPDNIIMPWLKSLPPDKLPLEITFHHFGEGPLSMDDYKDILSQELKSLALKDMKAKDLLKKPASTGTLNSIMNKLRNAGKFLFKKAPLKALGKLTGVL